MRSLWYGLRSLLFVLFMTITVMPWAWAAWVSARNSSLEPNHVFTPPFWSNSP